MAVDAFRRLWAAAGISNLGDGIGLVAVPLLAATLTRDPLQIGAVTAVAYLPYLLFGIPVGVLVDRVERRTAMVVANAVRCLLLVVLCLGIVTDVVTMWWIYVLAFAFATAECVYDNAAEGAVPRLVPADRLDGANARLQGTMQVANNFVGGPLGALLFAVAAVIPFGLQAAGHLVAALLVARLPRLSTPRPDRPDAADRRRLAGVGADVKEGLGWLWHHRSLRMLALVSAGMALANQIAQATIVLFALEELDLPVAAFGLFAMCAAVGALAGSIAAPALSVRFGRTRVMAAGSVVQPFTILAMGLSGNAVVAGVVFVAYAGLIGMWNVLSVSMRQQLIPSHLFGRVHGAWRTIVWGALPVGSWIGGAIARAYGLRAPWFVGAAVFAVVAVFAVAALRRLGGELPPTSATAVEVAAQPPEVELANSGSSASVV